MSERTYRTYQALILASLGLFLLLKAWGGELSVYVDGRIAWPVILSAVACMALAQALLKTRPSPAPGQKHAHVAGTGRERGRNLFWLAWPVLLGLVMTLAGGEERLRPPVRVGGEDAEIGSRGPVTLVFDRPMDAQTVEQRFSVQPEAPGRFEWQGNRMQFWPQTPLVPGVAYSFTLDAGAAGLDGRVIHQAAHWNLRVRRPQVAYLSPMNAGPELWLSLPDGSRQRRLTESGGRVYDYAVSPDGEWMVYSLEKDGGGSDLWQVNREGASSLLLDCGADACTQPAIAPNGDRVAYVRENHHPETGSPAGPQVWLLDRSGGATFAFYHAAQVNGVDPSWSPDGKRLAFYAVSSGGIRVVELEGDEEILLPSAYGSVGSWSPDGLHMLYNDVQRSAGNEFVIAYEADFSTGAIRPVLQGNPQVLEYSMPDWSPDGVWVATGVQFSGSLVNRQVWRMKLDGSEAQAVSDDFTFAHSGHHWSPSGQALVFQRLGLNSSDARPQVVVWQSDTGRLTVLAEDAGFPSWLP